MNLIKIKVEDVDKAMEIIEAARLHLKSQGIDQWQKGYPDYERIKEDSLIGKGYFVREEDTELAYLFIDFDGEPAYKDIEGNWAKEEDFVVIHRWAMSDAARGKGLTSKIIKLVEELALSKGVKYFRIDTDEDNKKMQHVLVKNGFIRRGIINFDNSLKVAFDKTIS